MTTDCPHACSPNRDGTFISLIGSAQRQEPEPAIMATCCNPLGRLRPVVEEGSAVAYAAAVSVAGLYTKVDDDRQDERGMRRLLAGCSQRLLRRSAKRAQDVLMASHFPIQHVRASLARQASLERIGGLAAAGPSADAFASILGHTAGLAHAEANREPLRVIGASLGRMIYLLDACVDRDADRQGGQFNPLHKLADWRTELDQALRSAFAVLPQAATALQLPHYRELIDGILLHRFPDKVLAISGVRLAEFAGKKKKKKIKKKGERDDTCDCDCDCDGDGGCDCCQICLHDCPCGCSS